MDSMIPPSTGNLLPVQSSAGIKREAPSDIKTNYAATQDAVLNKGGAGQKQPTHEEAVLELQKVIDAIQGPQKMFEISVHEKTHAIMIKVMNKETGDLIREVPPEKILDIAARMMEIAGIIIDKKV
ncbi:MULTISPECIES: flagellar protein FlaG [Paenibacillus]|uniref:flagellar protein FlaG n=1 Tax=Paenibacillus TaxID=44249 RepID=UPI0002EE61C8|nr:MULTISPECIES: flagellar protein FlaG [Paenibacillus]KKD54581.1 flagellar protein FlaG [Paenibacillus sp. ICGEB2008]MBE3647505.1 flagellar protein FlaG [Paenibacillus polymyxa]WOZ38056.1 flagellar protein FlaG [Paenibacillus polymyxa]